MCRNAQSTSELVTPDRAAGTGAAAEPPDAAGSTNAHASASEDKRPEQTPVGTRPWYPTGSPPISHQISDDGLSVESSAPSMGTPQGWATPDRGARWADLLNVYRTP